MSITVNSKTYATDSHVTPNVVSYVGPDNTASVKDKLSIGRTAAKPTSTFSGVIRSDVKLTRTLTLTNALTATGDGILEIKTSFPVGTAGTDIDESLDDMAALLASTDYKTLVKNSKINF